MSQTQTTVKTSKPLQTKSAPSQGQLRRLGFIPDVTLFTYSKLAELYKVGKGYVPSNFASQVWRHLYLLHYEPRGFLVADLPLKICLT